MKGKISKIILILIFLTAFGLAFNINVPSVKAVTVEELKVQIAQLQAQIAALQRELAELRGEEEVWCHDFNVNLRYGDAGPEVEALQIALEKEGLYEKGDNPPHFDDYVASAVVAFQEKYASDILAPWGLEHGTGYVGTTTRAKLNELYGCEEVVKPYVKVIYPNGGEIWVIGNTYDIKWTAYGVEKINIYLLGGGRVREIGRHISADLEKFSYTISPTTAYLPIGDDYKIRITTYQLKEGYPPSYYASDESDDYFSIVEEEKSITVVSPNGGEEWVKGNTYKIEWSQGGLDQVKINIELGGYEEDGTPIRQWYVIASDISAYQEYYNWKIPTDIEDHFATSPSKYKIRLVNYKDVIVVDGETIKGDESDNYFSILEEETCHATPLWSWDYCSSDCKCYAGEGDCDTDVDCYTGYCAKNVGEKYGQVFSMDACEEEPTVTCTDSDGGKNYYVKGTAKGIWAASGEYEERTDSCDPALYGGRGLSENYCYNNSVWSMTYDCPYGCKDGACLPGITILSPNGGESWKVGETRRISWIASGVNYVRIYIEDDTITGSGSTNYIYDGAISAVQGYYDWTIVQNQLPGSSTLPRNYKIRVDGVNTAAVGADVVTRDWSNAKFTISPTPSITVLSPNGGEEWTVGNTYNITWKANGFEKVVIHVTDYSCSSETPMIIATNISASQGSYSWKIPDNFFESQASAYCPAYIYNPTTHYGWKSGDNFKIFIAELKSDGTYGAQDQSDNYFSIVSETCHTSSLWSWDYCSSDCKCYAGEGDCDTDADCYTGYCAKDVGEKYGQVSSMDVCEEEPTVTCTDSDGGKNIYEAGEAISSSGEGTFDHCVFLENVNGILEEAICENGITTHVSVTCPSSAPYCRYAECTSTYIPACADTDGGIEPYIKGTVKETRTKDGPLYTDYCENLDTKQPWNNCSGASCGLREYYCEDPYRTTTFNDVSCPYGCKDGACQKGITVLSPDGGEEWMIGETYQIKWDASSQIGKVDISLLAAGKTAPSAIATNVVNDGEYDWTIPATVTPGQYTVFVQTTSDWGPSASDESDAFFSIVEGLGCGAGHIDNGDGTCTATLQHGPVDGVDTYVCSCYRDNSYGDSSSVRVGKRSYCLGSYPGGPYRGLLKFDFSSIPVEVNINSAILTVYSYGYEQPGTQTFQFYRATSTWTESSTWNTQPSYDSSKIWASFQSPIYRTWQERNVDVTTIIQEWHNRTYTNYGFYIKGSTEESWTRDWFASSDHTTESYRPKLIVNYNKAQEKSITILSPNGGEEWDAGSTYDITWISTGSIDNAGITILKNHERYCDPAGPCLATIVTPNTGSYSWTISTDFEAGDNVYTVKIEDEADPSVYDESDDYFSIVGAATPVGLENIETHLASVSHAISQIAEAIKRLIGR